MLRLRVADLSASFQAALAGRYTIEREVGSGGMAVVFLAQDRKHHRPVALKLLRPELGQVLGADRFLREIQIAARLNHPHILPLHDSGEAGGFVFYIMPYVEGESLRQRLEREHQLPLEDALLIASEVADALGYAHSQDVVHRDIKPENILLEAGHAVVSDFGIARAISAAGGEHFTATGIALGTPAYMSPEQAAGGHDVDGRSDVYSLGCVLYEMLAGAPPFTGATPESVLFQHLTAAPRPLTSLRAAVPANLDRVLERALAKTPADRFTTAAGFAEALKAGAAGGGPAAPTAQSVAVLPFANLSPDKENEYFSDGMTDELISALAKVEGLRVASRTSAFVFKGASQDIRTIGERLNVGTVLEGSVRRAANRLRVTAQLINVVDGYHLWSETYERRVEDVFAIQEEISRAIVNALKVRLVKGRNAPIVRRYTSNLDAYHLYLKGRYFWNRRTAEDLRKSVDCFGRAIALDPKYALAYAGLADSFTLLGSAGYGSMPPREAFPRAKAGAEQALAIDPTLAEAHTALAWVRFRLDWDWTASEASFKRALELDPGYATAHHWHAVFLTAMGRHDEAIAEIDHARELDPLSLIIGSATGRIYHFARQYGRAVQQFQRTLELDPNFAQGHYDLGLTYLEQSRFTEAIAELERGLALSGGRPVMHAVLAHAHARAGQRAEAERMLVELQELRRRQYVSPLDLCYVYIGLGERDRAFECLEQAYADRSGLLVYLKVEPLFDPLRADSRFRDLAGRLGLDR